MNWGHFWQSINHQGWMSLTGSSFSNVKIYCFSSFNITLNLVHLVELFEDVGSGKCFTILLHVIDKTNNRQQQHATVATWQGLTRFGSLGHNWTMGPNWQSQTPSHPQHTHTNTNTFPSSHFAQKPTSVSMLQYYPVTGLLYVRTNLSLWYKT